MLRRRWIGSGGDAMSWQPPSAPPPGGYAPPPGYPAYPTNPYYGRPGPGPGLAYASFWRRVGGYLIDDLIFAVPTVILVVSLLGSRISNYINAATIAAQNGQPAPAPLTFPVNDLLIFGVFDCVVAALYFGVLVAGWGSTVGQRLVGARVVCHEDPTKKLPLGRALTRAVIWWAPGLFGLVSGVGDAVGLLVLLCLLWVAWDPQKQGLHDKLGRALVVVPGLPAPVGYGQPAYPYPGSTPYQPPYAPPPQYQSPFPPGPPSVP
jgi:uncharacterized RDD family membrane protein YckC